MKTNWQTVEIGKLVTQIWQEERVDWDREYKLLGTRWYAGGLFPKDAKSGRDIRAEKLYRVKPGYFVYNRLFAWKGSFAFAGDDDEGYVSNEFPCFEVDASRVDVKYLFYYFNQESTWLRALGLSSGATPTSRNRLKEKLFLKMKIPLPPLEEQRRIVEKLETSALHVSTMRTLREEQGRETRQILLEEFWKIAQRANRRPFGEVAPIIRRSVMPERDALYSELGVRSFGKGTFHKPALSVLEIGSKRIFSICPGDLIFSNVFAWEGAIAVAGEQDRGRYGSHRFITCIPKPSIATSEFLCFFFLTNEGLDCIGKASPGGAGRNRTLGISALEKILVPVPSVEDQRRFGLLLAEVERYRDLCAEAESTLNALFPSLLSEIFSGHCIE